MLTSVWGVSHSQEWLNPNAVRKELQPLQRNDLIADVAARQPHDPASNLVFRQAVDKDVDALVALEAHARPMFRVGESGIRLRLRTFPEGVLVLEADKAVVAAIFAIRVEEGAEAMVYSTIERSHTSSGNTIQLIHIIANPTHRHLMDRFHKFITQTFWQIEGISSIFAITHTVGFDDSVDGSDYQEYVSSGMDRNIFFHRSHGALVEGIVDGFCLEDSEDEKEEESDEEECVYNYYLCRFCFKNNDEKEVDCKYCGRKWCVWTYQARTEKDAMKQAMEDSEDENE